MKKITIKDIAKEATPSRRKQQNRESSQLDGADSTRGRSEISATPLMT